MVCTKCNQEKEVFNKGSNSRKNGLRYWCQDCTRAYNKEYYQKNKEIALTKAKIVSKQLRRRNQQFLNDYLSTHPCVDCGERDILTLEFDHLERREVCVASLVGDRTSIKRIEEEIAKCEVRCGSCHNKVTHKRSNSLRYQLLQEELNGEGN